MRINVKKSIIIALDVILAAYVILAMTSFNNPDESARVCTKVSINIEDDNANGFLSVNEIKKILERRHLYPLNKTMSEVNPRDIEELLKSSPFVNEVQCYKTQDNNVHISVTQRLPIIRIKNIRGEDYYLDDKGGIMPNSKYTSDLIIATGYISRSYAKNTLSYLAKALMASDLWKNQIVQINVLPDLGIELVPRVGEHVVFIGYLPQHGNKSKREQEITDFVNKKMLRLEKFYKYGLSQAGWNKYPYINIEFDNQIICKKRIQ
ncbi:MAG: cell division protein FtsQ [Prevotella sp.]|nr:cell division protein FtsQ [Prevotella sp.]